MATLDQLPPDRRAIIELVLSRGQSYEDLSGALGMPEPRVREHAREALTSLAPRTAERVDPQWRAQVADYVLGQQSGPQAKATRAHLKGSEPARAWALSVLDSVGHLYPAGAGPQVPDGGGRTAGAQGERPRRGRRGEGDGTAAAPPPEREDPAGGSGAGAAAASAAGAASPGRHGALSAEARALVRRRRIVGAAAGVLAVIAVVLLATGVFGGGDEASDAEDAADSAAQPEVTAQLALQPVGDARGTGAAIIAEQQGQPVLLMQGRLPELDREQAYVVWLYNDPQDAVAVAVPNVDRQGNLQAVSPLPADYLRYRFLDVSLQERSDRQDHSGNSVLRASLAGAEAAGPEGEASPGGTEPLDPESFPTAPGDGG